MARAVTLAPRCPTLDCDAVRRIFGRSCWIQRQDLAANFSLVKLTTRNGRKMTGVRMNEDTWSIQVRDYKPGLHSFWKQDLTELHVEQRTLMPSYAKQLSEQEITTLSRFLRAPEGSSETCHRVDPGAAVSRHR